MKNILILTSYYYDAPGANGQCAAEICKELLKSGCNTYVVGYGDKTAQVSETPQSKFYTIKHSEGAVQSNNRIDMLKKVLLPPVKKEDVEEYYQLSDSICEKYNIDCVIAFHFPYETVEAAKKLKEKRKNIHFIVYELDSSTDGIVFKSKLNRLFYNTLRRWCRTIYRKADRIFIMQSHERHFEKTYKKYMKKTEIVDLPMLVQCDSQSKIQLGSSIVFFYTGLLDKSYRSPEKLLSFIERKKEEKNWEFVFYSKGNCEERIAAAVQNDNRIKQNGFVSTVELNKAIENADFFISIGNANSNSVPSKLFRYFSYGKPIIHFSMQENDVCVSYLSKYPLALIIEPYDTNDALTAKIDAFIKNNIGKSCRFEEVQEKYIYNTPKYSCDKILCVDR